MINSVIAKRRASLLAAGLLLVAGLSCDRVTGLPRTGSISVVLLSATGSQLTVLPRQDADSSVFLSVLSDDPVNVLLDGVRVTVTGPTNKSTTVTTATGQFFNVSLDGLEPGSYTVVVEGLVGGKVGHFGQVSNVTVTAGANTQAQVSFPAFQPVPQGGSTVVDTVEVLRFSVQFAAIPNATSYVIDVSQSPTMTSPTSRTVTTTTADITVAAEGKYFFTVRAVNATVGTTGLPSVPKGVQVFQSVTSVTVTPSAPAVVAGATQPFTFEARDADNVVVLNPPVLWTSNNHTVATIHPTTGVATTLTSGTVVISAVAKGTPGTATLTVNPMASTKLVFTTQPVTSTAGATMAQVSVSVQNPQNQTATGDNATSITVAFGNNAGGGTLGGTKTVTVQQGVANFGTLNVDKTGTGYTLVATATNLTSATSASFNITPSGATNLAFTIQPTASVAGIAVNPAVQVEVRDAQGNRAVGSSAAVTLSINNNPSAGTLSGTRTVNAINGVASFSGLSIDKAGLGYTLTAAAGGLTNGTSSGFDISAGAAAKLAFATQPLSAQIFTAFDPFEVVVQDAFGNRVPSASNEITLELAPNAGNSIAIGLTSDVADQGSVVFSIVGVNEVGTGLRFIASAPGLTSATSEAFSGMLKVYVVSTGAQKVSVIESSDNSFVTDIPVGAFPTQMAISPDGTRGYVTNFSAGSVTVLDLTTNTVVTTVGVGTGPQGVAVSPDGTKVYVANSSGNSVSIINTATNVAAAPIVVGTFPIGVAFTPDGSKAFVVNQNSDNVTIFNATTDAIITTVPTGIVGGDARNVAISPDGQVAYVTNSSVDQVTVFRVSSNSVITSVPTGDSPVGVVFSPDGRFGYVVSSGSRNVAVHANGGTSTAHPVVDWMPIGAGARKLAVSPSGSFMYVANQGSTTVTVINTVTRSVVTTLATPDFSFSTVWGVTFGRP